MSEPQGYCQEKANRGADQYSTANNWCKPRILIDKTIMSFLVMIFTKVVHAARHRVGEESI